MGELSSHEPPGLLSEVSSWDDFIRDEAVQSVEPGLRTDIVFRGQSNKEWKLVPSLLRAIEPIVDPETALRLEEDALEEFASQAHLYLPPFLLSQQISRGRWWMLMQHYRAPSRLLDWTTSPYVAAYFAASDNLGTDGAIWALNLKAGYFAMPPEFDSNKDSEDKKLFCNPQGSKNVLLMAHGPRNERMIAQQGVFMLSQRVTTRHDDILLKLKPTGSETWACKKIVLPSRIKRDFLSSSLL